MRKKEGKRTYKIVRSITCRYLIEDDPPRLNLGLSVVDVRDRVAAEKRGFDQLQMQSPKLATILASTMYQHYCLHSLSGKMGLTVCS